MPALTHIDPLSFAKIIALMEFVVGIVLAVVLLFFGNAFYSAFGNANRAQGMLQPGGVFLIALPFIALIGGFAIYALEAIVYNFLVKKLGGIKLTFKGNVLQKIDPWSMGKISLGFGVIFGVIIGIIEGVFISAFTGTLGFSALIGVVVAVFVIVFSTVGSLLGGLIGAFVYNLLASAMGGIIINIKKGKVNSIGILSYAKFGAVLGLIIGLFVGVIYTLIFYAYTSMPSAGPSTSDQLPPLISAVGPFALVVYPILYMLLTFGCALLFGWLYNWLSPRVGPIKVLLK